MGTVLTVIFYILIMVLVFGVLIFIHEFGHFFTARRCGVTIKEFAIGMGPTLFSWKSKKYDTKYALRLFPIGGYVSMVGEDEASEDEGAFCNKSVPKRMLVVIAGALMNLLLGFLLMLFVVILQGPIGSNVYAGRVNDEAFNKLLVKDEAIIGEYDFEALPIKKGDKIISVDGTKVYSSNEVVYEIMNKGYQPIDIVVEREGNRFEFLDVVFPSYYDEEGGAYFGYVDFMMFYPQEKTVLNVLGQTVSRSASSVKMIYDSLIGMVTGRFGMDAVSGPVGVAEVVGQAAQTSALSFIYIVAILTINLGVVNLLPFPALDGGRFLFLIIEGILRKPVNRKVEAYINAAGMIILLGFMILISFKDVFKLLFR